MNKDNKNKGLTKINPDHNLDNIKNPKDIIEQDSEIKTLYEGAIHDYTKKYPEPETILEVNGRIWGTLENFSAITGKAKSKKTYLLTAIIPALLTGNTILKHITGKLSAGKNRILYFDTEQSSYYIQQVVEKSLKLGGISKKEAMSKLEVVNLRSKTIKERNIIIEYGIRNKENIGVVIIDGLRDLIPDINNMEQASDIIQKLMEWTATHKIHIIVVLHQNKTDNRVRGHIGTELMNKCETLVKVSLQPGNKEITIVDFDLTKNLSPEPFAFTIGNDNLLQSIDIPEKEKHKNKKPESSEVKQEKYKSVLKEIFSYSKSFNQTQLIRKFKEHFTIGDNKAKDYISYCTDEIKLLVTSKGKHNATLFEII